MLLSLPVEVLDHAVGLLDGDVLSLGACSLTCRGLLPLCRARLWRHVKLFVGDITLLQVPWTTAFLDLLDNDPAIRPFVRSLVLTQYPQQYRTGRSPLLQEDRVSWRALADRLPCLRSLRLQEFRVPCLYDIISIAGDLPTVEVLYVKTVRVDVSTHREWTSARALPASSSASGSQGRRWGLRTLSFEDALVPCEELAELVSFLERSTDYISLDALDLHWWVRPDGSEANPRWSARWPQVPSFGGTLSHFGVTFNDIGSGDSIIPEGRESLDLFPSSCILLTRVVFLFHRRPYTARNVESAGLLFAAFATLGVRLPYRGLHHSSQPSS